MGSKTRITPYILTGPNYLITWNPKQPDTIDISGRALTNKDVAFLANWLLKWVEKAEAEKGGDSE